MNPSSTRRVLNQATLSRGGSKGEGAGGAHPH